MGCLQVRSGAAAWARSCHLPLRPVGWVALGASDWSHSQGPHASPGLSSPSFPGLHLVSSTPRMVVSVAGTHKSPGVVPLPGLSRAARLRQSQPRGHSGSSPGRACWHSLENPAAGCAGLALPVMQAAVPMLSHILPAPVGWGHYKSVSFPLHCPSAWYRGEFCSCSRVHGRAGHRQGLSSCVLGLSVLCIITRAVWPAARFPSRSSGVVEG